MKNLRITAGIIITAIVLFSAVSCKKDFYTKANNNPNAPTKVPPGTLLTPIEVTLGYTQGGDMSRFASMFVQQTVGVTRQSQAYYEYIFTNQDPETMWDNMYTAVMENDYTLMNQAAAGGYNEYKGISEVLMAYSLQITVDCWGGVPYSQAFLGATNLSPSFDNDVALYNTIMQLCNQAIVDLNNPSPGTLTPSVDDVIYNGNASQWIKFAHAVKARIYIHQSQTHSGNAAMADSALAEVGRSFTSNADNARVLYGTAATANAPWYQFYTQRGDISYAFGDGSFSTPSFMWSLLTSLNDPRKLILIDSVNESQFNYLNSYYQLANSPVEFICYDELQFIAAEATLRSGGTVLNAQTYYQAGISNNMRKLSPFSGDTITAPQIATYLLAHGNLSPILDSAIAEVAFQEYIALYLNPEAWVLWRRTTSPSSPLTGYPMGSPALTPVAGPFQSNGIPRRILYPQSELNLNTNMPAYARSASEWSPRDFWDN